MSEQPTPVLPLESPLGAEERRDLALIEAIARGDRPAFDALYRLYYARLMPFITRMVRLPELAEEIVNDAMYAVWTGGDAFAGRSKASTWIFGIAYKKALKRLERERRTPTEALAAGYDVADDSDPVSEVAAVELAGQLDTALARLSPGHRSVVELTFLLDYSYEEVAQIVGCPVNTVKTRMFHARAKLRQLLAACLGRTP
ncbi:MAG: sigma-70 family RNA polymerase sigma factor [Gammaproteobacteria bacterium]|nr:sigma-70 family RNA polymerase sigma factor [Gammaproteobacteria bacterium]